MPRKAKVVTNAQEDMQKRWIHAELVANAMMSRTQLMSSLMDPRRDLNHECGYPETSQLTPQMYRNMFDRESVAARVVEVVPLETWKVQPSVFEDEDMDVETQFEQAWEEMTNGLRGESWYQDEEGSPIWDALLRADVMSGVGSYGVLLLGADDGLPLNAPLEPKPGRKLLFLRVFDESLAQISAYEMDMGNPRYGKPTMYLLTFADPAEVHSGQGQITTTESVHWSRVVHLADNLGSSELFGVPRMRPVFNNLHNLCKLYGGSAEMYWRGAFPGISLETHPQLGGDVEVDAAATRESMEQYMNGLQRYFSLMGMSAKSLAPQVVDPTPQINTQLEAICIKLGIPKRVFMGSERGELSSGQDKDTWDDRLRARQRMYVTPRLIVPFVDRCIVMGFLPEPEGYSVSWPDLSEANAIEQATNAGLITDAMSKYVGGSVDVLIEPKNFLTKVLHFTDEEAEEISEATTSHVEEGGISQPVDEREEAMADLDIVEKEKSIEQIGKPKPVAPVKGK
jgi:hypothetical protein